MDWPNFTSATIAGQHHNRRDLRFQGAVQVRETLQIQHLNLVDKEHTGHQLRDALVDVAIHHFVNLPAEFLGDFRLFRLRHGTQHGHNVIPSL